MCAGAQGDHKRASVPGTEEKGSYELLDVDAGNRTQILWKSSKCAFLQP